MLWSCGALQTFTLQNLTQNKHPKYIFIKKFVLGPDAIWEKPYNKYQLYSCKFNRKSKIFVCPILLFVYQHNYSKSPKTQQETGFNLLWVFLQSVVRLPPVVHSRVDQDYPRLRENQGSIIKSSQNKNCNLF